MNDASLMPANLTDKKLPKLLAEITQSSELTKPSKLLEQ